MAIGVWKGMAMLMMSLVAGAWRGQALSLSKVLKLKHVVTTFKSPAALPKTVSILGGGVIVLLLK